MGDPAGVCTRKHPVWLDVIVRKYNGELRADHSASVRVALLARQNLDGILAINEEAWQVYAKFLVHAAGPDQCENCFGF